MSRFHRASLPVDLVLFAALSAVVGCSFSSTDEEPKTAEEIPERFVQILLEEDGPAADKDSAQTPASTTLGAKGVPADELAKKVADNAGVLGAMRDETVLEGLSAGDSLDGALGGLVGSAPEIGIGGLGTRGAGIGGGGTGSGTITGTIGYGAASGLGKGGGSHRGAFPSAPLRTVRAESLSPSATPRLTDYGVNKYVLTAEDPLSTFAVDVDTASYAMTRGQLQRGYLPAPAAVRVEEFVNSFDYEYRQPPKSDPFAVDFEASPSPWNPRNHIVRVGVQGRDVSLAERKPVHLTFLVDTSGSMQASDKIGRVQQTLQLLTKELRDGDTVAIATYAGNTSIVLQPTGMGQRAEILAALRRLSAGGSTAMGAGIDLAYSMADEAFVPGAVNRVIICSDGDANVGQTSQAALSERIKRYAAKGITLTTVGFGAGSYNDTMMEQLANDGDGNYFFIDSEREAKRVFVDRLGSTMEVIAKDVKIQVEWNPAAVQSYRLIGYENRDVADKDFRNDAVDAGEIGAGHQVTALYEVALNEGATGPVGVVRVRNKAPGPEAPAVERSFALERSSFVSSVDESSRQFRIALASATFAEVLRGSPFVTEVSLGQVASLAAGAQRAEYPADAELVSLVRRAAGLKGEAVALR